MSTAFVALAIVLVVAGCLYLLFRRGSIAHRARDDYGDEAPPPR